MRRQWISIHLMFLLIRILALYLSKNIYFNTSHVSINHNNENEITKELSDFNTSHVSINRNGRSTGRKPLTYFNTSHVSINLTPASVLVSTNLISIHLMFLLIIASGLHCRANNHFNTSHVSINRRGSQKAA